MEKLKWDYCECGCKCYVAEGTDFHIYWDLDKSYTLFEGRFRNNLRTFDSMKDAKKAAQERLELRHQGHNGPVGEVKTGLAAIEMATETFSFHLNKMKEIAAEALSILDRYSIDCALSPSGPWYTIEHMWGMGHTAMLSYATRYQGMGGLSSIHIRVVRNGNVAEASLLRPKGPWEVS